MPPDDYTYFDDSPTSLYYEGMIWQEASVVVGYDTEQGRVVFTPIDTVLDAEFIIEDVLDAEVLNG